MDDDVLSGYAEKLIEGEPERPLEAPRKRRKTPIRDVREEGERYLALRVGVDADYRRAYRQPGQYVTLSPEQLDPRFLVIATAPGTEPTESWEFLVDRETELGASIDPLDEGEELEISPPEGPGYPADDVADRDVLCFVTGSGIASIRPAIQYWNVHADLAPRSVTIYYGESRPGDFAYENERAQWAEQNLEFFLCNEGRGEESDGFRYVQHAFREHDPDLRDTVVFIAGAPVMKRRVVDLLVDRGVDLDRIATNV